MNRPTVTKHQRLLFAFVLPFLLPATIYAEKTIEECLAHDAVISFDAAISQDPDNYKSYYRRATVYLSLGPNQAAMDDFTKQSQLET